MVGLHKIVILLILIEFYHVSDPEEQGCDIFSSIPAGITSQNQCKAIDDRPQITATSQTVDTDAGPSSSKLGLDLPQKNNNIMEDLPSTSEKPNECVEETSTELDLTIKKEIVTENEDKKDEAMVTEKESEEKNEIKDSLIKSIKEEVTENKDEKKEENDDNDDDEDSSGEPMTITWSESPLLDVYQVNGRPHNYYLMSQLLDVLAKTQTELVMAARTVETLELDTEEFEACTHSCTLGSSTRTLTENQSSVILVRVTPAVDQLLGIETLTI